MQSWNGRKHFAGCLLQILRMKSKSFQNDGLRAHASGSSMHQNMSTGYLPLKIIRNPECYGSMAVLVAVKRTSHMQVNPITTPMDEAYVLSSSWIENLVQSRSLSYFLTSSVQSKKGAPDVPSSPLQRLLCINSWPTKIFKPKLYLTHWPKIEWKVVKTGYSLCLFCGTPLP